MTSRSSARLTRPQTRDAPRMPDPCAESLPATVV